MQCLGWHTQISFPLLRRLLLLSSSPIRVNRVCLIARPSLGGKPISSLKGTQRKLDVHLENSIVLLFADHSFANDRSFSIGDPSEALVHIGVLIDPLSEPAQKWSSLLEVGAEILANCPVIIIDKYDQVDFFSAYCAYSNIPESSNI